MWPFDLREDGCTAAVLICLDQVGRASKNPRGRFCESFPANLLSERVQGVAASGMGARNVRIYRNKSARNESFDNDDAFEYRRIHPARFKDASRYYRLTERGRLLRAAARHRRSRAAPANTPGRHYDRSAIVAALDDGRERVTPVPT